MENRVLAQSIELALKAYLRTAGMGAKNLQAHSIRHNLTRLDDEAIARGLNEVVVLDDFDRHVIEALSGAHQVSSATSSSATRACRFLTS